MKKYIIIVISILILAIAFKVEASDKFNQHFLMKPTGEFGVGFQDYHWINTNICPDPMFNGTNQADFSKNNFKFCHEIMARIYYPVFQKNKPHSPYYYPFINAQKERLIQIPSVTKVDLAQLNKIRSFSRENAYPILGKKYPVILFSPGYGCPVQVYENFITEIVSHGYIIVGINSPFISGDIEFPNKHTVKFTPQMDIELVLKNSLPIQSNDLSFIFQKIQENNSDRIFSLMNLQKIGTFGHSLGGLAVSNITKEHPTWFQAAVALDVGGNSSIEKSSIPFMHLISASFKHMVPIDIELGSNGYVVSIAPSEEDYKYSYHMNLSDMSTLQYLTAYQKVGNFIGQIIKNGCDMKFISHDLTKEEISAFNKTTYVLIKNLKHWILSYYEGSNKMSDIKPSMIKNFESELNRLPEIPPEELTDLQLEPIKKIIGDIFIINHSQFGQGNGWKLSNAINTYLNHFFNFYLMGQEDEDLKKCNKLTDDTLIRCGF